MATPCCVGAQDLAEWILALTTLTDFVALAMLEAPNTVSQMLQTAHSDILTMRRSLVKREILEYEKIAKHISTLGSSTQKKHQH